MPFNEFTANTVILIGTLYDTAKFILGDTFQNGTVELIPKITESQFKQLSSISSHKIGFKIYNTSQKKLMWWNGVSFNIINDTAASYLVSNTSNEQVLVQIDNAAPPTTGQKLTATSPTTAAWQDDTVVFTNPMTTLGDMISGGASGSLLRLPGSTVNGLRLLSQTVSGGIPASPNWITATSFAASDQSFFLGNTSIAINRTAGPISLTGISSIDGLAATATKLATARLINGISFDGTTDITITAVVGPHTHTSGAISDSTSIGKAYLTLTNPSAITFPRMNVDNTVSSLTASDFRTAIGAGTSSLTLGILSSNAYYGDFGKIAYDHSQITTGTPHGTAYAIPSQAFFLGNTSIAINRTAGPISLTGITSIDGLAASATKLETSRLINGVSFDGTADITIELSGDTAFEFISKNIKSWNYTFNYIGSVLQSIIYTSGLNTITKTLNYSGSNITSIVLSGDTPGEITLTKTITYVDDIITTISYS